MSYKFLRALLWALDVGTNFWARNAILVVLFSAAAYVVWPYMQPKELWVQIVVAFVMAVMIILVYSAATYFALSLVDSVVTFLPNQHFTANLSFERAKAKLIKGLVERDFQFSLNPIDQYSPGLDEGVFSDLRKRILTNKPPFIAVSRKPFLVVKIVEKKTRLEKLKKAIDSRDAVEVMAAVDAEDSTGLSFLKYLETALRGPPA